MTLEQLKHAIRAACEVSGDIEVFVIGSQAILGQFPDPPGELTASVEADIQPKNKIEKTGVVDGSLGELSMFHDTHGFYVQGVIIEETAYLPEGWQDRLIRIADESTNGKVGFCLEVHDLAASKIKAHRDKDREFVRTLIYERMVDPSLLNERIVTLPILEEEKVFLQNWVDLVR